jgi:hypothetical protein
MIIEECVNIMEKLTRTEKQIVCKCNFEMDKLLNTIQKIEDEKDKKGINIEYVQALKNHADSLKGIMNIISFEHDLKEACTDIAKKHIKNLL